MVIGDGCDIGIGRPLPGATIGDGAQIGAGAVVSGDIPEGAVAAGVPARVLRRAGDATSVDLRLGRPDVRADALDAIGRVLASGHLTQGPVVAEFEAAVAAYRGAGQAIATTSRHDRHRAALAAARRSVPATRSLAADFTYPATGNAVLQRGATLRLVDADPRHASTSRLEAVLTPADEGGLDRRRLRPARRLHAPRAAARRAAASP